jgi:hypothetical protein
LRLELAIDVVRANARVNTRKACHREPSQN